MLTRQDPCMFVYVIKSNSYWRIVFNCRFGGLRNNYVNAHSLTGPFDRRRVVAPSRYQYHRPCFSQHLQRARRRFKAARRIYICRELPRGRFQSGLSSIRSDARVLIARQCCIRKNRFLQRMSRILQQIFLNVLWLSQMWIITHGWQDMAYCCFASLSRREFFNHVG